MQGVELANNLQRERILLVREQLPMMMLGSLLGSVPLALVVNDVPGVHNLEWLLAIYLYTGLRYLHSRLFAPNPDNMSEILRSGRMQIWLAMVSGIAWGASGLLFFDARHIPEFTFLILTLVCMISGSMTSLSPLPLAFASFAIPAMSPLILAMLMEGERYFYWMAAAASFFLIFSLLFSRNIRRRVEQYLALKYENLDLVANLQHQTEALREQTLQAEKASEEKTRFLATASHDLRQPLHAAVLFLDSLERKLDSTAQRHAAQQVRRGLDALTELFNALLDISRLDADVVPVNRDTVSLTPLIDSVMAPYRPECQRRGLILAADTTDLCVHSDPLHLRTMLDNLIGNAVRYTRQGTIEVSCKRDGERVLIAIKDTGIGIAAEDIPLIFDEFRQLDNPHRDRGKGLGLGLAIVRRLSKLMDHPVAVASRPDQGSTFTIAAHYSDEAPAALSGVTPPTAHPETRRLGSGAELAGLTVLVVDDERDIRTAMCSLIESWGGRCVSAGSSDEVMALLADGLRPDLVISDYRLPGTLDGIALIARLRETLDISLPALLVSGDILSEVMQQARASDLTLLHKPVKPAQLRMAVRHALAGQPRR